MFGFIARAIGGALTPLIDQISEFGARLVQKLALFLVAALCLLVVASALTLAFGLWVNTLAGPIVGCLAVAGLYLVIAGGSVFLALRKPRPKAAVAGEPEQDAAQRADRDHRVDDLTAPLLGLLQTLGLRREQLAVVAGATIAKQLGPVPLVGLAIVAGFLIGRMVKSWRTLLSIDAITDLLASLGLFGFKPTEAPDVKDAA